MKKALPYIGFVLLFPLTSCSILNKFASYPHASKYHVINSSGEVFNDSVKEININWVSGKIIVEQSSEYSGVAVFEKTYDVLSDKFLCHIWHNNAELNINFCESNVSSPKSFSKDLIVYIPLEVSYESLIINSVSSSINISGGIFNSIEINNVSGNVTVASSDCKAISYDGVSGSFVLEATEATSIISIDQVSGSTIISLHEDTKGFDVEFDSVSGVFSSDFETLSYGKNYYYYGDKSNLLIEVESVSGDLSIAKFSNN